MGNKPIKCGKKHDPNLALKNAYNSTINAESLVDHLKCLAKYSIFVLKNYKNNML